MAQLTIEVNGRAYQVGCEDGQEDHLRQLAKDLDDRINSLRGQFGEIGDSRLVVMAALMIADDGVETVKKVRRLEQEIAALQDARGASAERVQATQTALIAAFTSAAERIEGMAKKLNQPPPSDGSPSQGG